MFITYQPTLVVFKPEGKRPLERRRFRWQSDIKTDPKETLCEGVESIHQAQDTD